MFIYLYWCFSRPWSCSFDGVFFYLDKVNLCFLMVVFCMVMAIVAMLVNILQYIGLCCYSWPWLCPSINALHCLGHALLLVFSWPLIMFFNWCFHGLDFFFFVSARHWLGCALLLVIFVGLVTFLLVFVVCFGHVILLVTLGCWLHSFIGFLHFLVMFLCWCFCRLGHDLELMLLFALVVFICWHFHVFNHTFLVAFFIILVMLFLRCLVCFVFLLGFFMGFIAHFY